MSVGGGGDDQHERVYPRRGQRRGRCSKPRPFLERGVRAATAWSCAEERLVCKLGAGLKQSTTTRLISSRVCPGYPSSYAFPFSIAGPRRWELPPISRVPSLAANRRISDLELLIGERRWPAPPMHESVVKPSLSPLKLVGEPIVKRNISAPRPPPFQR